MEVVQRVEYVSAEADERVRAIAYCDRSWMLEILVYLPSLHEAFPSAHVSCWCLERSPCIKDEVMLLRKMARPCPHHDSRLERG